MPFNDDVIDEDDEAKAAEEQRIAGIVSKAIGEKLNDNQALSRIVADPQVQQVLEARRLGKKVAVNVGDTSSQKAPLRQETAPEPEDWDDPRAVARFLRQDILQQVGTTLKEALDPIINPLKDDLQAVKSHIQTNEAANFQRQVVELQKKYPDFDQFKPQMRELLQQNPGLGIEELYLISKRRSGDSEQAGRTTSSEKPTHERAKTRVKKESTPMGRRGWNTILDNSLSALDVTKFQ